MRKFINFCERRSVFFSENRGRGLLEERPILGKFNVISPSSPSSYSPISSSHRFYGKRWDQGGLDSLENSFVSSGARFLKLQKSGENRSRVCGVRFLLLRPTSPSLLVPLLSKLSLILYIIPPKESGNIKNEFYIIEATRISRHHQASRIKNQWESTRIRQHKPWINVHNSGLNMHGRQQARIKKSLPCIASNQHAWLTASMKQKIFNMHNSRISVNLQESVWISVNQRESVRISRHLKNQYRFTSSRHHLLTKDDASYIIYNFDNSGWCVPKIWKCTFQISNLWITNFKEKQTGSGFAVCCSLALPARAISDWPVCHQKVKSRFTNWMFSKFLEISKSMMVEPRFDLTTARVGGKVARRMNSSRRIRISQFGNFEFSLFGE